MLAAVEAGQLLQVVWVSLVAGVLVTTIFSLSLYGGSRAEEARRDGRDGAATAFGLLAVVASVAFLLGVVLAVKLLVSR
jgi:uncharacterized membrane protein